MLLKADGKTEDCTVQGTTKCLTIDSQPILKVAQGSSTILNDPQPSSPILIYVKKRINQYWIDFVFLNAVCRARQPVNEDAGLASTYFHVEKR
jgi:hypothetical protein